MSSNRKKILSTTVKAATGVTMVALSGAVPQVATQPAKAATINLPVSGAAPTGITFGAVTPLKFGSLIGTLKTGKLGVTTAGAYDSTAGASPVGAAKAAATIVYDAKVAAPLDVKISKLGPLTLTGAGNQGTVELNTIKFNAKLGAGALTLTATAAGTTAKTTNYAASAKTGAALAVGGVLSWLAAGNPAGPPIGTASVASGGIVLTFMY
jgi:hypothetical protein